jgi:hypothetical protein
MRMTSRGSVTIDRRYHQLIGTRLISRLIVHLIGRMDHPLTRLTSKGNPDTAKRGGLDSLCGRANESAAGRYASHDGASLDHQNPVY